MVAGAPGGTHHFAGAPDTTWADFARAIMARAGLACTITDIPTIGLSDARPAARPIPGWTAAPSTAAFGIARPDWRAGLDDILQELTA